MTKQPKRPRDTNQLAKFIVGMATGDVVETDPNEGKDPAAVARGRLGGIKGGRARADSLTQTDRADSAQKAAQARWAKKA